MTIFALIFLVIWLIALVALIGSFVTVFWFPPSAGRNWLSAGFAIFIVCQILPIVGWFTPFFGWSQLIVTNFFSILGWFFIWIGLVKLGQLMFQKEADASMVQVPQVQRGLSLLLLGIFGLVIWPLAPLVRYRARRDLLAMEDGKLDESQQRLTQIANRLGWVGSLLLVGGVTSAVIIVFVLFWGPV